MKLPVILLGLAAHMAWSQQVQVATIDSALNASGGVTVGRDGYVYVSDFGDFLNKAQENTHVYRVDPRDGSKIIFASGFKGASGACFDSKGNFYQSNPFGRRISKVASDGTITYNWCADSLRTPIGLAVDRFDNVYVCDCGANAIRKVDVAGKSSLFAKSENMKCPNGLTIDDQGMLYACNFSDGKVLKIDQQGNVTVLVELPVLQGGQSPVGNGHLTWKNGVLFVTTIGRGEIYVVTVEGKATLLAGKPMAFSNLDGAGLDATFSKPNGIAASITGDTLYVNGSKPTWAKDPLQLHPANLRMITGVKAAMQKR